MEVKTGVIETLPEEEEQGSRKTVRVERGGGNGSGSNGGGRKKGDGGGGDDGPGGKGGGPKDQPDEQQIAAEASITKYKIGMWALLGLAFMTFMGLTAAYVMLAANPQLEWRPFDLPFQLWISTALILISSLTFEFGKNNLRTSNGQAAARTWMMVTTGLGAVFIASQVMAWLELVNRGVYVAGNPYAGFFYILTVAHALHVVGGMAALGYVVLRTWVPTSSKEELIRRHSAAKISGWFWHFLTILWLVLFTLLGFWK